MCIKSGSISVDEAIIRKAQQTEAMHKSGMISAQEAIRRMKVNMEGMNAAVGPKGPIAPPDELQAVLEQQHQHARKELEALQNDLVEVKRRIRMWQAVQDASAVAIERINEHRHFNGPEVDVVNTEQAYEPLADEGHPMNRMQQDAPGRPVAW